MVSRQGDKLKIIRNSRPVQEIIVGINGSPEINSEQGRWQYNVQVGLLKS